MGEKITIRPDDIARENARPRKIEIFKEHIYWDKVKSVAAKADYIQEDEWADDAIDRFLGDLRIEFGKDLTAQKEQEIRQYMTKVKGTDRQSVNMLVNDISEILSKEE
ncbi:hypothetical protein KKF61_05695 [Patescibacteria group bacterium]|nr:hypothetical protein [Patescibacteria group bacterium]MBU0963763.1 hypothetical protein [Patescibacteria group bacterium]